jgi:hypothetical protein
VFAAERARHEGVVATVPSTAEPGVEAGGARRGGTGRGYGYGA